jgi:uncharacterized SAM-dependent methyltransferase
MADLTVSFQAGETVWTESSHKFELDSLPALARSVGFEHVHSWVDSEWPFAENLWVATEDPE